MYDTYDAMRKLNQRQGPAVIHFMSETKPWTTLGYEYIDDYDNIMPSKIRNDLYSQARTHLLWRQTFYRATNQTIDQRFTVLNKFLNKE
jgi:lipopolysaccharide biosynthesis glycosyltransferase